MRTKQNESRKGNLRTPLSPCERYRSSGTICYNLTIPSNAEANLHLQSIGKSLVHLGDLGRNAKVNGAVTNLNDESTNEVGVDLVNRVSKQNTKQKSVHPLETYLGNNLELLALAELRLGNSLLKTGEGLGIELLRTKF